MMKGPKAVTVEKGYRCPFCKNHDDCYYMIWEGLLETPICDGCNYEISLYFFQLHETAIWFLTDTLPIWERIPILEKITGKSIHDLRLSYLLWSLNNELNPKDLDERISFRTEQMDESEKKIIARKEQGNWIAGIRRTKKMIRRTLRLQEKMQAGFDDDEILSSWRNKKEEGCVKCKESINQWIGVDLDGTLAEYNDWISIEHIGNPIMPMVDRVKGWLAEGKTVKIFTARVTQGSEAIRYIHMWLLNQGLPELEVTNVKDFNMLELWDDRCVSVVTNTGIHR